jgi:hypothetical protein
MALKITFDFNCVIALENEETCYDQLKEIISVHENELVDIQIPGIAASERMKNGEQIKNFSDFEERINKISKKKISILSPIAILGVTYWDRCIFSDKDKDFLDLQLQRILFPKTPINLPKDSGPDYFVRWKNARCDVVSMWCHIFYSGDIFVTSDRNFSKSTKLPKLIELGAKKILTPKDTIELFS